MNIIFKKAFYRYWSMLLLCVFLFACQNDNRFRLERENSLEINKDRTVVAVGGTLQLTVDAVVEGNIDPPVKWNSDDEDIATVDETSGLVQGEAVGEVTITAVAEDNPELIDSLRIMVVEPLASLTLTIEDNVDIANGTVPEGVDPKDMDVVQMETELTRDLKVTLSTQEATNRGVDLSFDEEGIATIQNMETDEDGNITFNLKGETTGETILRATAQDGFGATDQIQVKVTKDHFVFTVTGSSYDINTRLAVGTEVDPLEPIVYNFNVDLNNDGIFDQFGLESDATLTFETDEEHTVRISGSYPLPLHGPNGDRRRRNSDINTNLIAVNQWGTQQWLAMTAAFQFCVNLEVLATDAPDLSKTLDMTAMFEGATSANPDVSEWDTSSVISMEKMFSRATNANPDVSQWNVSNVTIMNEMFSGATNANPDVSQWNTGNAQFMQFMFEGATSANPDVSRWNTSSAIAMENMFEGAINANPDVSQWDIPGIEEPFSMQDMFKCSRINVENYEEALINFSGQVTNGDAIQGIDLGEVPVSAESQEAIDARTSLIENNWSINDGVDCEEEPRI